MSTNFLDCKYIAFYPLRKTSPCIFSEKSCLLAFFRTLGLNPYLCCSESVLFACEKCHYSANINIEEKNVSYTFISHITDWYKANKRDLPWRNTQNPYHIWISEVILQQTRVVQGMEYYFRFTERFPTIKSLAEAPEDEVLKLWEGLGYYSRARNLHAAAQYIATHFGGEFPSQYKDIISLKGIGEYTAAAIASFAFGLPYAAVDGNVQRVLSRLFAIEEAIDSTEGKKILSSLAQEIMNEKQPALHNQAMMEFGALHCTPLNPLCLMCPVQSHCLSFARGIVDKLPFKKGKTAVKYRYFHYLDIRCKGKMLVRKRITDDIWKNLYEIPLIETDEDFPFSQLMQTEDFQKLFTHYKILNIKEFSETIKHILTHRIILARFTQVEVEDAGDGTNEYQLISVEERSKYAFPRLINRYFETSDKLLNTNHIQKR